MRAHAAPRSMAGNTSPVSDGGGRPWSQSVAGTGVNYVVPPGLALVITGQAPDTGAVNGKAIISRLDQQKRYKTGTTVALNLLNTTYYGHLAIGG